MIFAVAAISSAAPGFSRLGGAESDDFRLFFYGTAAASLVCLFIGSVMRRGGSNSHKLGPSGPNGGPHKAGRRRRRRGRKSSS